MLANFIQDPIHSRTRHAIRPMALVHPCCGLVPSFLHDKKGEAQRNRSRTPSSILCRCFCLSG